MAYLKLKKAPAKNCLRRAQIFTCQFVDVMAIHTQVTVMHIRMGLVLPVRVNVALRSPKILLH